MRNVKSYIEDLSHIFFPFTCKGCGLALSDGEGPICNHCCNHLPTTKYWEHQENPVERIFWGKLPVVRASSFLYFTKGGMVQQMMHNLKYQGHLDVGSFLGEAFGRSLKHAGWNDVDMIVPVPLHPKKLKKRGYNQCDPIVEGMGRSMGVEVGRGLLERTSANESQTRKGRYDRWLNVKELFRVCDPEMLRGRHVLIVDDVVTTGATIEACAGAVLTIDGVRVSLATIGCPPVA